MTKEIFWTIISILVTIIIAMVGGIISVRNEISKRSELKWKRAIALAEVISSDDTPPLVRQIAHLALYDVGIEIREFESRAQNPSLKRLDSVVDSFDTPPSLAQALQLKQAIEQPPVEDGEVLDPDIKALIAAGSFLKQKVMGLEAAFSQSRNLGRAEDDTRLRIIFVMITMAAAFLAIFIASIRSAIVSTSFT